MTQQTRSQFFCNQRHRIAYLMIHKCACSSIIYRLARLKADIAEPPLRNTAKYFDLVTADENQLADYLTFTFVRNPHDRFLSFYADRVLGSGDRETLDHYRRFGIYADMPFDECVAAITAIEDRRLLEAHAAPQVSFVFRGCKSRVRFLGRLESIAREMEWLARACGFDADLPHVHPSRGGRLQHLYDPSSRRKIYDYYREDFEYFGYPSGSREAELDDGPAAGVELRDLVIALFRCKSELRQIRQAGSSDGDAASPSM